MWKKQNKVNLSLGPSPVIQVVTDFAMMKKSQEEYCFSRSTQSKQIKERNYFSKYLKSAVLSLNIKIRFSLNRYGKITKFLIVLA